MMAFHSVSLNSLPPDLLHLIAFHLSTDPIIGPPSNLVLLLSTSRRLYSLLNPISNPHLYAQIFRSTFDISAIRRRFGSSVGARALADELARRWCSLSRIRRWAAVNDKLSWQSKSRYKPKELREDLFTAYLMLVESDGYNALQLLRWARIEDYLAKYKAHRLVPEHIDVDMPSETEEKSLFMWVSWLLLDYHNLLTGEYGAASSWQWLMTPYTIGTFAYKGFYASWTHHHLPSPPSNTRSSRSSSSQAASEEMTIESPLEIADNSLTSRPLCSTMPDYLGVPLRISLPLLSQAATLLHVVRYSQIAPYNAAVPPPTVEQLLEHARQQGGAVTTSSLHTEDDLYRPSTSRRPYAPDHLQVNFNSLTDSSRHDDDWHRLISCRDPYLPSPRRVAPSTRPYRFKRGSLAGEWDGRFMIVGWFSRLQFMSGSETVLNALEEANPVQHLQAWKIQEHHYKGAKKLRHSNEIPTYYSCSGSLGKREEPNRRKLGKALQAGDPMNAFLPPGSSRSLTKSLVWDGRAWHAGLDVREYGVRGEDLAFYKTWTPDDLDEDDSEETDPDLNDDTISTIITGEAIAMAPAYSSLKTQMPPGSTLFGTIRKWDGLVTLRVQSANTTDGPLIYRGYLVENSNGFGNWVGRWRDADSDVRVVGYEGSFVMSKRQ